MTEPFLSANIERFNGFADTYDAHRPKLPAVIVDMLTQIIGIPMPKLVVDIGCGTGLSTRAWAGRAEKVIGIEPSADMRRQAEFTTRILGITGCSYQDGLSVSTGLPAGCADIVTCSQALHWMEPATTFQEIGRILRPGGLFAAIDCDFPPVIFPDAEELYKRFTAHIRALAEAQSVNSSTKQWPKESHLERIRESGFFGYTRELLAHSLETGNAERLVGLALSMGAVEEVLKSGVSEEEAGLFEFRLAAESLLGSEPFPWYLCYRVRLGVIAR